jgi:hypothetical protein
VDPSAPPPKERGEQSASNGKPWNRAELLKLSLLGLVTAYLLSGLVLRQGFGLERGPLSRWFPVWLMFSGASRGVTQVRYVDRSGKHGRELDRFSVLGLDPLDQSRGVWRLWGHRQADALGKKLCRKLGTGAKVEMVTRTARAGGWSDARVVQNVCAGKRR